MDMRDGSIHELDEAEMNAIKKQQEELMGKVHQVTKRNMMQMNEAQLRTTKAMPARKARAYMRKQPCDCGSGRQARKCCFKKVP